MENSKHILRIALACSLVLLSLSALILSIRSSTAHAAPTPPNNNVVPIGVYTDKSGVPHAVGWDRASNQLYYLGKPNMDNMINGSWKWYTPW